MVKIYFLLNQDGFLLDGYSFNPSNSDEEVFIEVDKQHEVLINPDVFKYVDGELIKDEERQQQLNEKREKEEQKISKEERNEMAMLELANLVAELKGEL